MKTIKPEAYALELKRSLGLGHAMRVAEQCAKASSLKDARSLPTGPVFYYKDKRGELVAHEKEIRRTHGFWTQVLGILKK